MAIIITSIIRVLVIPPVAAPASVRKRFIERYSFVFNIFTIIAFHWEKASRNSGHLKFFGIAFRNTPSGTAGRPMLDVILGEDIYNVAVVVTRYFGGVLLGTGGLVRAYSKAVQEGLAASKVILKQKGIALKITTDYTGLGKIQYIAGERNIPVLDSEYTDKVVMKLLVPVQDVGSVQKAITEGTNGRAGIEKDQELYYAVIDGKVITFDH